MRFRFVFLLSLTLLAACAAPQSCHVGNTLIETRLYFGMNKPHGTVSPAEWNSFVHDEIAPRFHEGFTIVEAHGFWTGDSGRMISENSKVVTRLHSAAEDRAIEEIIADYKKKFAQEAVLRVDAPVCAAF